MFIKLFIIIISFLLLFNETFKILDKFKKKHKRLILLISLSLMFFLSIADIINEVNESNDLIQKANTIINQSDTVIKNTNSIIIDLDENIKSLEKTSKSIVKIDNSLKGVEDTLSNQVIILKNAVEKSKELVKLEELKFIQDQAIMISYNKNITLTKNIKDSTKSTFKYRINNEGKRTSEIIELNAKLYYYTIATRELLNIELNQKNELSSLNNEIPYKSFIEREHELTWRKAPNKFDALVFVLNCQYKDVVSNKSIPYNGYFIAKNLKSDTISFSILNDFEFATKLNDRLLKDNLKDYLIDLNKFNN